MAFSALTAVVWLQLGMTWILPTPAVSDLVDKAVPWKVGHVFLCPGEITGLVLCAHFLNSDCIKLCYWCCMYV